MHHFDLVGEESVDAVAASLRLGEHRAHICAWTAEKIIHHLENSQAPEITVLDAERGAIQQTETGAVPGLEGTSDPLWIYLACYRVLKANGDDRAADILSAALKLLRAQALKIEDADLQYSFLNNVKVNREIQAESAAGGTV